METIDPIVYAAARNRALDIAALRAVSPRHARVADWIDATLPPGCSARIRPDPRPIGLVQRHGSGPYLVLHWEDCGDRWAPTIETPDGPLSIDSEWLTRVIEGAS